MDPERIEELIDELSVLLRDTSLEFGEQHGLFNEGTKGTQILVRAPLWLAAAWLAAGCVAADIARAGDWFITSRRAQIEGLTGEESPVVNDKTEEILDLLWNSLQRLYGNILE